MFSLGGIIGSSSKASAASSSSKPSATPQDAGVQTVLRSQVVRDISSLREFEEDLNSCELLGQGSYGSVHLITEKVSGQRRVLKSVTRPESWNQDRLRMEGLIMKNLDHPHILRLFEWFENGDLAKLVCELCEGGELLSTIRKGRGNGVTMEEKWGAIAMRQSFQALSYLHNKNIVHKDLKGENLLLLRNTVGENGRDFGKPPHVVICDLGTAEICGRGLAHLFGSRGTRVAGTPATMAPEALNGNCSTKSDIWSMGCVMYEMLTNQLPFNLLGSMADAAKKQVMWLELHKQGPKWDQLRCSPNGKQLCQKMLQFREGNRPSALECLRQPWVAETKTFFTKAEKEWLSTAVQEWHNRSPCRQALCLKMAATCTFIDSFAEAYLKIDTDQNGMLEKMEVLGAFTALGMDRETGRIFAESLDVNGDGAIHYLEFSAMCLLSLDEEFDWLIAQEFKAVAKNRGCITQMEMAPLIQELRKLGGHLKFEDIDLNKDGKVDFKEFCTYFGRPGVRYEESDLEKYMVTGGDDSKAEGVGGLDSDGGSELGKVDTDKAFRPPPRSPASTPAAKDAGHSTSSTATASTTASATKTPKASSAKSARRKVAGEGKAKDKVAAPGADVQAAAQAEQEEDKLADAGTEEIEEIEEVGDIIQSESVASATANGIFLTPAKPVESVTVSL